MAEPAGRREFIRNPPAATTPRPAMCCSAVPASQRVAATARARRVRWLASLTGAVVIAVVAALARVVVLRLLG